MLLPRPVDSGFVIGYTRRMKRLIIIAALCIIPVSSYSHPGKTDWRGGHKCIKAVKSGAFFTRRTIFMIKTGCLSGSTEKKHIPNAPEPAKIQTAATETVIPAPLVTSKTQTVTVSRYVANVHKEDIFFFYDPLLSVLLILFLLLLTLRMNRRTGKELSIRRLAIPGPLVGSPAFNFNMIPRVIIQ
jgi:hypothetical protein